jgi:cytochrome c556
MRFLRVTGAQSGFVLLLLISASIAVLTLSEGETSAALNVESAAPPDKTQMEKFMTRKLAAAQRALEGVSRYDHAQIQKATAEMIELSRQAAWEQMADYRFVQDTTDFVAAAEFLSRMASAKDVEGASLGFMRLTMTCTNCHHHVRTASVAKLDIVPEKLKEELVASISGAEFLQAIDLPELNTPRKRISTDHHTGTEGQ